MCCQGDNVIKDTTSYSNEWLNPLGGPSGLKFCNNIRMYNSMFSLS